MVLFGFIYWQTALLETIRLDEFLTHESAAIAREPPDLITRDVATRYARELHRQTFAALFTPRLARIAGDVAAYPARVPVNGRPVQTVVARDTADGPAPDIARAVARALPDGRVLLVGRSENQLAKLRYLVLRALGLGLLPAMLSALCIGALASRRTLARLQHVNETIDRIMQGHLSERLHHHADPRGGDAFDSLARSVNRMLDEIERLVGEVQGVGSDIAHDLRTPLTRVRARLDRARSRAASAVDLLAAVDASIADLDQAFGMITALLRIAQIEGAARRAGFAPVSLTAIAREVVELYQPMAELQEVSLSLDCAPDLMIPGDRDLLFEAAANLLDNAVKFTPRGGHIAVSARMAAQGPVFAVRDTGPGIPAKERPAALQRFHRADRSRTIPGHGLGLSLVAAIVRLHLFHLHMEDANPGLLVELRTWAEPAQTRPPETQLNG